MLQPFQRQSHVELPTWNETSRLFYFNSHDTSPLMCGCFLWRNAITPSGFAASAIISEDTIRNDTLHQEMVLDLSTKFEMSSDSLNQRSLSIINRRPHWKTKSNQGAINLFLQRIQPCQSRTNQPYTKVHGQQTPVTSKIHGWQWIYFKNSLLCWWQTIPMAETVRKSHLHYTNNNSFD